MSVLRFPAREWRFAHRRGGHHGKPLRGRDRAPQEGSGLQGLSAVDGVADTLMQSPGYNAVECQGFVGMFATFTVIALIALAFAPCPIASHTPFNRCESLFPNRGYAGAWEEPRRKRKCRT